MIQPINHDVLFLSRVAKPATKEHLPIVQDLEDTLRANAEHCVGMAANMIGKDIAILSFLDHGKPFSMLNPKLTARKEPYETQEGCLSIPGIKTTTRYRIITVQYQDRHLRTHTTTYRGFTAQIIQHELDHLNGILI